ncbi:MAG TPA: hypothetical protein VLG36_03545 [Candidatus Chromulinivoraceae bacterium]|nr:hypothetical protein [Candidatus Chromulinivoraceae bacterium]
MHQQHRHLGAKATIAGDRLTGHRRLNADDRAQYQTHADKQGPKARRVALHDLHRPTSWLR